MCVHIRIEVLVASAILGILRSARGTFVSFALLDAYGVQVARKLESENETAYWIYSREQVDALFADYSELFERAIVNGREGIKLREGIGGAELEHQFLLQLTCKLEQALKDPEVLKVFEKAA